MFEFLFDVLWLAFLALTTAYLAGYLSFFVALTSRNIEQPYSKALAWPVHVYSFFFRK